MLVLNITSAILTREGDFVYYSLYLVATLITDGFDHGGIVGFATSRKIVHKIVLLISLLRTCCVMKKMTILIAMSVLSLVACGKGGDSAKASGEGCEGIGAMDAKMKCENNSVMFCSSYSSYKWQETQKCAEGKTCFISEDGKSGGCK